MGCYINPHGETKEAWLDKHGIRTVTPSKVSKTTVPVCLVNNGWLAAGVGFSEAEVRAFNDPHDPRSKKWYTARREDVRQVSDLLAYEVNFPAESFPSAV